MTVRKLLEGKSDFVSLARPEATVQEIIRARGAVGYSDLVES